MLLSQCPAKPRPRLTLSPLLFLSSLLCELETQPLPKTRPSRQSSRKGLFHVGLQSHQSWFRRASRLLCGPGVVMRGAQGLRLSPAPPWPSRGTTPAPFPGTPFIPDLSGLSRGLGRAAGGPRPPQAAARGPGLPAMCRRPPSHAFSLECCFLSAG